MARAGLTASFRYPNWHAWLLSCNTVYALMSFSKVEVCHNGSGGEKVVLDRT